jgi:hypothetical protein
MSQVVQIKRHLKPQIKIQIFYIIIDVYDNSYKELDDILI